MVHSKNGLLSVGLLLCSLIIIVKPTVHISNLNHINKNVTNSEWWKHAVIYQIYPRSFMDSNNDGIGDLQGILQRLNHLVDLGVDAFWLSPIFPSPMVDFGYDVSNYCAIDPIFGTMQDFDDLVRVAHEKGLRVILDFIPNHSSNEHEWFKKSLLAEGKYKDYYVWRKGRNNNTKPPNNWISHFGGPTWTYHAGRDLWYLHQYAAAQPDLNYRNPAVIKDMIEIMRFWLDRGIDGLRVDTAPSLFEHAYFPDEEIQISECRPTDRCFLRDEFQRNRPQTYEVIYTWRTFIDEYSLMHGGDERIMITESPAPLNDLVRYYGSEDGRQLGAHLSFNFWYLDSLTLNSTAEEISWAVNKWLRAMDTGYISNWVLGTHDNHRLATRLTPSRSIEMLLFTMVLPGVATTYNGEEIGMEDGNVTWEQGVDPKACNDLPENFPEKSRDFERTPFHWDSTVNAGFNNGTLTWLPVSKKYVECNVALQMENPKSHLNIYKKIVTMRKSLTFRKGTTKVTHMSESIVQVKREYNKNGKLFLMNISGTKEKVNLQVDEELPMLITVDLCSPTSKFIEGEMVPTTTLTLQPYEAIIFNFQKDHTIKK